MALSVSVNGILSDGDDPSAVQTRAFRALRYVPDYPAFDGRDLTPQGPIENNPVNDNCVLGVNDVDGALAFQLYPTLVKDILYIETFVAEFTVDIFNIQGQLIRSFDATPSLELSSLDSGLYFVKLYAPSQGIQTTVKIIKE